MHREERRAGQIGFSEKDFKVCDLCGALNRAANNECFICGWNGYFHQDEKVVRNAMREFADRYGGVNEAIIAEELLPSQVCGPSFFATLIDKIKAFFSGKETAD